MSFFQYSYWPQSPEHESNHGYMNPSFTHPRRTLVVLAQPPVPSQPCKGPFHYPPLLQYLELLEATGAFYDLQYKASKRSRAEGDNARWGRWRGPSCASRLALWGTGR